MKLEAHNRYLGMTGVIANLENKLIKVQKLNPRLDYSEQEAIIAILKDYHFNCMEVVEENRIVDKKYLKMANKYDFILAKHRELQKEYETIKTENDKLKESIH